MKKAYIEYIKTKLRRKPPALKIVAGEDYYIYGNKMVIINCNQSTLTDMRFLGIMDGIKSVYIMLPSIHCGHATRLGSIILYCYLIKGITPILYSNTPRILHGYLTHMCDLDQGSWEIASFNEIKSLLGIEEGGDYSSDSILQSILKNATTNFRQWLWEILARQKVEFIEVNGE